MKKAHKLTFRNIIFFMFSMCLFIFNLTSCGMDMFYVMEAPEKVINKPNEDIGTITFENKYFEFETNETWYDPSSAFNFLGTEVYYKIYKSRDKLISETSYIETLADDSSKSSSATDYMKNCNYNQLKVKDYNDSPLIPYSNSNKTVYIRLTDYLEDYTSRFEIAGSNKGQPVRAGGQNYTFNFGRSGEKDKIPVTGDFDYSNSDSSSQYWYVAMFAVAVGLDTSITQIYSTPLYLGNIVIDDQSSDN